MPIVTFVGNTEYETGNTSAAIATATYMSIKHNMKILLISTSCNEDTVRDSFWVEKKKKGLFAGKSGSGMAIQSGIEGISRMISSNKIEPRIIRDYTKVILRDRFDVLLGFFGEKSGYKDIQKTYPQIISVASQFYDIVMVDIDKEIRKEIREEIIKISNVIVPTVNQNLKNINRLMEEIKNNENIDIKDTLITVGRYDDSIKMNVRNISRNMLGQRKIINAVPYNGKFLEAMQEGMVIDLFLELLKITNVKDPNYVFLKEVGRLVEDINHKWEEVKMRNGIQ